MRATKKRLIAVLVGALVAVFLFAGVAQAKKAPAHGVTDQRSAYTGCVTGSVTAVDLAGSKMSIQATGGRKVSPGALGQSRAFTVAVDVIVYWQTPVGPMPGTLDDVAVGQNVSVSVTVGKKLGRWIDTVVIHGTPPTVD